MLRIDEIMLIQRVPPTGALYARRKRSPPNKENKNMHKQMLEKGHNSVRKGQIKKIQPLRTTKYHG